MKLALLIFKITKDIIGEILWFLLKSAAGYAVALALVPIIYVYSIYTHIKYRKY